MKRLSPVATASILGLVLAMSSTADLSAAELNVVAGGSLVPLFKEIGPRYQARPGGYTRIFKLAKVRQGDAAPMGVIALLGEDEVVKAPTKPAVVASST